MNKLYVLIIFTTLLSFNSCSDWLEVENVVPENESLNNQVKDVQYYANLREWKDEMFYEHKSKFLYAWYGWLIPEEENSNPENYLSSLPDSLGLISLWADKTGKAFYSEERYQNEIKILKKKGTRIIMCIKAASIGISTDNCVEQSIVDSIHACAEEYGYIDLFKLDDYPDSLRNWPKLGSFFYDDNPEFYGKLLKLYIKALVSRMDSLNMDGYDFDHEPTLEPQGYANLWKKQDQFNLMLEMLSEHIGPCAKTEEGRRKFLIVDGELTKVYYKNLHRLSYMFPQTYSTSSNTRVQSQGYAKYVLNAYTNSECRLTAKGLAERVAPAEMKEGNYVDFNGNRYSDKWFGLATFMPKDADGVYMHSAGCGKFTEFGLYYDSDYPYETYPWATRLIRELATFKDKYPDKDEESVKQEYYQEFIDNDWWPVTYQADN